MSEEGKDPKRLIDENDALRRRVAELETETRRLEGELRGAEKKASTAREATTAEEARFRDFFENSPVGKSMTARDGKLLRVNDALAAMLGFSVEELQSRSWSSITYPDDVPATREAIRAMLGGKQEKWEAEKRFVAKAGNVVWTRIMTRLLRDGEGRPLYFLTNLVDITGHKDAERRIETQLDEHRRWQEVMLHREDRIQELKREVNELCRRLSEGARYASQEPGAKAPEPGKPPR